MSRPTDRPASGSSEGLSHCDVLVIGGGPAGATIAALLAREGRDVAVFEKSHHPRFHIGESLLPANVALFEKLGVRAEVERIGMPKWGVEFVSPDHDHRSFIEFAEAWDRSMPYAWQVRRSELDELLFRNARRCGARVHEGARVRTVELDDDGATVQVEDEQGVLRRWRTRFVVDASGRDTLLANQMRCKEKNKRHDSCALYAHYRGLERLPGKLAGNITIFWFTHGWFWLIPLADGTTSIGAVCWPYYLKSRQKPLEAFFDDTIASSPELVARMTGAERVSDVHATGNYAYSSRISSGKRFLMLGDAYAFIDPVFSSGVFLAMQSAFAGLDVVEQTLTNQIAAAAARRRFDRTMRHGPREFSWFIFRVTNPTLRGFFMDPRNPLRVKEALVSLLAGDIFGKTPIWRSIFVLKALYYAVSLAKLPGTWHAWKRRRVAIRDVEAAAP